MGGDTDLYRSVTVTGFLKTSPDEETDDSDEEAVRNLLRNEADREAAKFKLQKSGGKTEEVEAEAGGYRSGLVTS